MKYNISLDAIVEPKDRNGTSYSSACEVSNTENVAQTIADMLDHTSISGTIREAEIYVNVVKEDHYDTV